MSLEVDCRDSGYLFPAGDKQEEKIRIAPDPPLNTNYSPPLKPELDDGRIARLRRANRLLCLALILAVVMAIIAAAVGGSVAVKREQTIEGLQNQLAAHVLNNNDTTASPSSAPSSAPSNFNSTSNSTGTVLDGPINNCTSMISPAITGSGKFNLHCGNDLLPSGSGDPAILGVYVYTFMDCINACASFNHESTSDGQKPNTSCAAVTWNRALTNMGNCWLQTAVVVPLSGNVSVDAAILSK